MKIPKLLDCWFLNQITWIWKIAAKNGLSNIFKLLAPAIKNINAPCPDGLTLPEHASKTGHTVIEELLIQICTFKKWQHFNEKHSPRRCWRNHGRNKFWCWNWWRWWWHGGSVVIVILKKTFQTESSHVEHVEKDLILVFSDYNWFQYNFNQFKTTLGIFCYFFFICKINSLIRLILSLLNSVIQLIF